ncbi:MAG: HNH endonuclease signature motif containing protein [Candidatus Nanopelagicales bacterium]|nr:HNH endonuclease signature motif containing protein [Candidatus Nanopelagicales bacterium]MDZ4250688.1 HNH endonuclease signature motif containing protein [Candidatus Nanopelagicales bacterium]
MIPARLAKYVQVNDSECWIWMGTVNSRGYGSVTNGHGKSMLAHRGAWEFVNGPIPDGLTVNHKCFQKRCLNTEHMELLTAGENTAHARRAIRCCPAGHDYTPENTRVNAAGHRSCRECANAQRAAARFAAALNIPTATLLPDEAAS